MSERESDLKKRTQNRDRIGECAQGTQSIRKKPKCKLPKVTREPFVEALSRQQDAFSIKLDCLSSLG